MKPADDAAGVFPWDRLDGRPVIYASLGTLQNRLTHVFRTIAEACAGSGSQLVLALGRKGASPPDGLPGNPVVVDYAPQVALLRRTSLVITHGGLNTTLESLSHGLPLVVVPIANDQPGVAARVAHLGLGEFTPVRKLNVPAMRRMLDRVLTTPGYRERSARMARTLQGLDGPARAADLIESAFATRRRVVRVPTRSEPRDA
jgi:MGT family glycosyltransferase